MRFEYEKLTSNTILRRVIEHERDTGKRVQHVVLTRAEWKEFLTNETTGAYYKDTQLGAIDRWNIRRHPSFAVSPYEVPPTMEEMTITVRCE